jgi:hypothetical protein
MGATKIPVPVISVVGSVLGPHIYNHRGVDQLFIESGAPGEPPARVEIGNCADRCEAWLKRCNADEAVDALGVLGAALRDFMDAGQASMTPVEPRRERIKAIVTRHGLRYELGGHVRGGAGATPSRTFEELLRRHDFRTVADEFDRSIKHVETDPAAALTAACATLESICIVYIQDEGLSLPAKKVLGELWAVVKTSLGFDPKSVEDDDLKRILGGLASIADGMAAFRTHAGSAHGRGRGAYRPEPRHARLGIHAAHTLAAFIIETWDERSARRARGHAQS